MIKYSEFAPTGFDSKGLGCIDQQDWLVVPCGHHRDSGVLDESNWAVMLSCLKNVPRSPLFGAGPDDETEEDDYEIHRFGHWANGWFEIVLVRPGSAAAEEADKIESALADYPVLDESDFSEREMEEANAVWEQWGSDARRLEYIRDHRSQFEFDSIADLMGCVRGKFFAGYASELIER